MNKKKTLKLGYHAVKCRGQKQLDDAITISEGKIDEMVIDLYLIFRNSLKLAQFGAK
jgi:hypothetical protein